MIDVSEHPVLLFDGVCNLCNGAVDWVVRHDRERLHRFASLQGESARELAPEYAGEQNLSTFVLVDADGLHVRSTAVLLTLRRLGGMYGLFGRFGLAFPVAFRDAMYRFIAKRRYRMFGKRESCRLPIPAERELFYP